MSLICDLRHQAAGQAWCLTAHGMNAWWHIHRAIVPAADQAATLIQLERTSRLRTRPSKPAVSAPCWRACSAAVEMITPRSSASSPGRRPQRDLAGPGQQQADAARRRSQYPRDDYQRETAVVRSLIAGKGVAAHQRQERVIEQLHGPQHARHEDGGGGLQREEGLPNVHDGILRRFACKTLSAS
jgi:hypothetical protein